MNHFLRFSINKAAVLSVIQQEDCLGVLFSPKVEENNDIALLMTPVYNIGDAGTVQRIVGLPCEPSMPETSASIEVQQIFLTLEGKRLELVFFYKSEIISLLNFEDQTSSKGLYIAKMVMEISTNGVYGKFENLMIVPDTQIMSSLLDTFRAPSFASGLNFNTENSLAYVVGRPCPPGWRPTEVSGNAIEDHIRQMSIEVPSFPPPNPYFRRSFNETIRMGTNGLIIGTSNIFRYIFIQLPNSLRSKNNIKN